MRTFGPLHLLFHDDDVDDDTWEPFLREDDLPPVPAPVTDAKVAAPPTAA